MLIHRSIFPCTAQELHAWHEHDGALERLIPPWENTRVLERTGGLTPGAVTRLRLSLGPLPLPFTARHLDNEPGRMFRDHQEQGPFRLWEHTHLFTDIPEGAAMEDRVRYSLPLQKVLPGAISRQVHTMLRQVFHWRHKTLAADLMLHRNTSKKQRILLSGASGVIGRALIPLLTTGGHRVWSLVRRKQPESAHQIYWNPDKDELDMARLPEVDAVIHLAGEPIGLSRWSGEKMRLIRDSRIRGTRLLAQSLGKAAHKPAVFLSASAIGYYGDCGEQVVDESAPAGPGFISEICREWEEATHPAQEAGIRTVQLRIGIVLTPRGGGLKRMTAGFRPGFISRFGSGHQAISWIHIDDMISTLVHVLVNDQLHGPLNIAAPNPVSNHQFMQTLAQVMNKPLLPPMPAKLLQLIFGQMASEVVLSGSCVSVDKLLESGYQFRYPHLEEALRALLGRQQLP
ncbi:MAG: TIGR01777 family protein [Deltaproteobacteria bacterium]|nr:MAG: TIGR01777 family protein [Deltaproteobacteria bacterium]